METWVLVAALIGTVTPDKSLSPSRPVPSPIKRGGWAGVFRALSCSDSGNLSGSNCLIRTPGNAFLVIVSLAPVLPAPYWALPPRKQKQLFSPLGLPRNQASPSGQHVCAGILCRSHSSEASLLGPSECPLPPPALSRLFLSSDSFPGLYPR